MRSTERRRRTPCAVAALEHCVYWVDHGAQSAARHGVRWEELEAGGRRSLGGAQGSGGSHVIAWSHAASTKRKVWPRERDARERREDGEMEMTDPESVFSESGCLFNITGESFVDEYYLGSTSYSMMVLSLPVYSELRHQ